jgi:hypothetical protein
MSQNSLDVTNIAEEAWNHNHNEVYFKSRYKYEYSDAD